MSVSVTFHFSKTENPIILRNSTHNSKEYGIAKKNVTMANDLLAIYNNCSIVRFFTCSMRNQKLIYKTDVEDSKNISCNLTVKSTIFAMLFITLTQSKAKRSFNQLCSMDGLRTHHRCFNLINFHIQFVFDVITFDFSRSVYTF